MALRINDMARILLINPNTNAATTEAMLAIARAAAPAGVEIEGITARFGADLIEVEETLETASHAVAEILAPKELNVVGIAEAGMHAAAQGGRRFSIVTTTSGLADPIKRLVSRYGLEKQFASLRFTEGPAAALMGDPEALADALKKAASEARDLDGAEAVVIGGGPLARAARRLAVELALPIIEPVPEAIKLVTQRIATR
jgi:allantoin racemase